MTNNNNSIYNSFDPNEIREMQDTNTEILLSSQEYAYWQKKLLEDHECRFYRKFKSRKSHRKFYCEDRSKFKGTSKWYGEIGLYYTYQDYKYNLAGNVSEVASRHLVKCGVNHQARMLFDSKKAADNFIRYNAERIKEQNGYAPIRSYYCSLCGGWHVTSQEYKPYLEGVMCHTEFALKTMDEFNESMKKRTSCKAQTHECVYEKFKKLQDEFLKSYAINDFESMADLYDEMYNMIPAIEDRDECQKAIAKLSERKRDLMITALEQDDMSVVSKHSFFCEKDLATIKMFMTLRRLMDRFDEEFLEGNYSECRIIYNAVNDVKDLNFYGNGVILRNFLKSAGERMTVVEETLDRIKRDIDEFISAYNDGDMIKCRLIEWDMSLCDTSECDSSTFEIYTSALNLMHTSVKAVA